MNRSTKAALISALIFPGIGHLYLKQYLVGFILSCTAFSSVYYLISKSLERAMSIVDKFQGGVVLPDIATITEMVTKQSMGEGTELLNLASVVFLICWIVGIIDSYRLGKKSDNEILV